MASFDGVGGDDFPAVDFGVVVTLGGWQWLCDKGGLGGKRGQAYYEYKLVSGGITMGIRRERYETVSNLWVEVGSIPLAMHGGIEHLWGELRERLQSEGIHIVKELVSRVDLYADFDNCEVGEFCRRFYEDMVVMRAKRDAMYDDMNAAVYRMSRKCTGFSIGGDIRLRCYDKRHELRNDPVKWGIFADRYNGIPEVLTRVEFQLRRNALKKLLISDVDRIDDVASYLKVREALWRYLTESWFRLVDGDVDKKNNHQSRAKTWTVWEAVQSASSCSAAEVRIEPRRVEVDMGHLKDIAYSCLCKAAVLERDREMESLDDFLCYVVESFNAVGEDRFFAVRHKHWRDKMRTVGQLLEGA